MKRGPFLPVDVYAQSSRLNTVNPTLKLLTSLALIAICVSAKSPLVGAFLAVLALCLTVFAGGISPGGYIHMLSLPLSFLLVGGLALLFEFTSTRTGVISLPVLGGWLSVVEASRARALLVMSRALGAVSCLYFLNLTTPMADIIGALRRLRCPNVLISLMFLVYRHIFILFSVHRAMRDAAASRLGFLDYRRSIRTTARLYSGLLANSYRQAGTNFDAMESRCCDTDIRFLERANPVTAAHAAAALWAVLSALGLTLILK